jgi:hypothetical protein
VYKLLLVILLTSFNCFSGFGDYRTNSLKAISKIEKVTTYSDRAEITRSIEISKLEGLFAQKLELLQEKYLIRNKYNFSKGLYFSSPYNKQLNQIKSNRAKIKVPLKSKSSS